MVSRGAEKLGPDAKLYQQTVERGAQYLRSAQGADGAVSAQLGPAVTALAVTGLIRTGRTPDDPLVATSLKYLEGFVHEDGGLYANDSRIPNYETCVIVQALVVANGDGRYDKLLKGAERYVREVQIDEGEGQDHSSLNYGGAGYGKNGRPDLSNTGFLIDALHDLGVDANDEAIKKAIVFVSRCQNYESQYNTTPFAAKNPDGGFFYTVAAGGASAARENPAGGLRSYGTMSYAGFKSFIYAGLKADDIRVKAAVDWLKKHYDLKENPGMGDSGLYYYYYTFARALDAAGIDYFADEQGAKHDWRKELAEELASRQQPSGAWSNQNSRWMEGDPNLVTSYALVVLSYCRPREAK
jgi:squalene-hopene/tetraprenyl-beta-curcumene cyclase